MSDRVASLRRWLLGGGILLVLVIAGFITYSRLISRLHHIKLPANLGVNVMREAGGWTLSRSKGSKTLYTIHAARLDQGRNGKSALHDVSITVFGANGDRRDRIYGEEFEYDEKNGVIRALGQVHIDLQGALMQQVNSAQQPSPAANPVGEEAVGPKVIHVITSGLVYLEKLGVAATSDYIEFRTGDMMGHATGADYSSDSGVLLLHSAVSMTGTSQGRPMHLTAGRAQFDQRTQQAMLTGVRYASAGRHAEARESTLYRRSDGSLGRVLARGDVKLDENGAEIITQRADIALNAGSQPESAVFSNGVHYSSAHPLRNVSGQADEARIAFEGDRNPEPRNAVFSGAVHLTERTRQSPGQQVWNSRDLTAERIEATLASGDSGNAQLRTVAATGNARLAMIDPAQGGRAGGQTYLAGDSLKAKLVPGPPSSGVVLDSIIGTGHTSLREVSTTGVDETSTGDSLNAVFRHGGVARARATGATAPNAIRTAVQEGHVRLERKSPGEKNGHSSVPDVQQAVADKAAYDGDVDQVTLSGGVRVSQADGTLWARQVVLDRISGDAQARGGVKVDFVQRRAGTAPGPDPSQTEPMHVLAERAVSQHATEITTFYGGPVRAWQGGSQVQAPEIEIDRQSQRMIARGSGSGGEGSVRTVLASGTGSTSAGEQAGSANASMTPRCSIPPAAASSARHNSESAAATSHAVRITSGGLTYSGHPGQADFTGGVRVDSADTTMRAAEATAYFQPGHTGGAEAGLQFDRGLDRVVAAGQISIVRPGLNATGGKLVYTADTGTFLLTGSGAAPPRATGPQGAISGAALRFKPCDDTVEALGDVPGEPVVRVTTKAAVSSRDKGQGRKR